MENNELNLNEMEKVAGGLVVEDKKVNKYWVVRQDGSVIGPAPDRESAIEDAKAFSVSSTVITPEEYKKRFGKELKW